MKARRTIVAALFAVVAASLVLAGAAFAKPPSQTGQVFHIDETYVDPYLSSVCGFDVLEHDFGVIKFSFAPNAYQFRQIINLRQTLTNPETGTSVVVRITGNDTFSYEPIDENGSFVQTFTTTGLNFLVLDKNNTVVSSGRGVATITVIFDENGNIVEFNYEERTTPHLEHSIGNLDKTVCKTLAQ